MLVSNLSEDQRGHLIHRIDRHTGCGLGWANSIANGNGGDLDLVDVFKQAGMTPHRAKIHARKVINFKVDERKREAGKVSMRLLQMFHAETRSMTPEITIMASEFLRGGLKTGEDLMKILI